ncbi:MAG TPA: phosphodiester glycosidase family protein, partial [Candidatus Baltobacteraceae bacterium]|nr:phosphodiester glycosidase family protein [Candidatus Baltobacteraceae bacterium]
PTIDEGLESTHRDLTVQASTGSFAIDLVKLRNDRFAMITDVAADSDCGDACAVKSLSDYAKDNGATMGIHGTYFCPPDYADCAGKTNTFLSPVYDTASGVMINEKSLLVHQGPMIAEATDGRRFYFHRTKDFGGSVGSFENVNHAKLQAAMANYPSLIEDGQVIVESEARLDGNQKTVKATRGGIGWNGHSTFLVIAHSATVVDLAYIMQALGAVEAMNLDGGGSSALLYDGAYKVGPGRLLPNAILFKKR